MRVGRRLAGNSSYNLDASIEQSTRLAGIVRKEADSRDAQIALNPDGIKHPPLGRHAGKYNSP
jgi:hypothetical protein